MLGHCGMLIDSLLMCRIWQLHMVLSTTIVSDMLTIDTEVAMATDKEWAIQVKGILKAELKRKGVGYKELSEKLAGMGVHLTERSINSKISRGGFTAVFFVQCLTAIGCNIVRLDEA